MPLTTEVEIAALERLGVTRLQQHAVSTSILLMRALSDSLGIRPADLQRATMLDLNDGSPDVNCTALRALLSRHGLHIED